jgi:hypothetical protein
MPNVVLNPNDPANSTRDVKRLKHYLRLLGEYQGEINSSFDALTVNVIKQLQTRAANAGKEAGQNGVVNDKTWSFIFDQLHDSPAFESLFDQRSLLQEINQKVSAIAPLSTTVDTINTSVVNLESTLGTMQPEVNKITSLSTLVGTLNTTVNRVDTTLGTMQPEVNKIADLSTTVGIIRSNLTGTDDTVTDLSNTVAALVQGRIDSARAEAKLDAHYAKVATEEAEKALKMAVLAVEKATTLTTDADLLNAVRQHRNDTERQKQGSEKASGEAAAASAQADQARDIAAATTAEREARDARLKAEKTARQARHYADAAATAQKAIAAGEKPPQPERSSENWEPLQKLFGLDRRDPSNTTAQAVAPNGAGHPQAPEVQATGT